MPEGAEVEVVRRGLSKYFNGMNYITDIILTKEPDSSSNQTDHMCQ